jgi:hypothetical protein
MEDSFMPKFIVDFEIAGDFEVEAKNEEEAKELVENLDSGKLLDNLQSIKVGRHYIEKVD